VVGADDKTDLAVLRIDTGHELPFVEFGDSDTAEVGDWVMAIGNPFGLGGSVTLGIVSARNRNIESGPYDQFIQTDAAINQGNSGGPLFDMEGKVVGINSAIIARGGSSLGIGFAVPGNLAQPVIRQLSQFGETRRGWLGVGIQDVSFDIASSLGLTSTQGALAVNITKGSPADGIVEEGDLILEFDGKTIGTMRDLPRLVAETEVGKVVDLKVLRDGKDMNLSVTLGRLETGEQAILQAQQEVIEPPPPDEDVAEVVPLALKDIIGLEVGPIDDAARKAFVIREDVTGVIIKSVTPDSDASRQGLVEGLVISEVNQQDVSGVEDFELKVDAAREAGRPNVLFKITDPTGANRFIPVQIK
ncbi:MAG: trypsin-like peptidase domain-containing protein, partial [Devosia sp.]